MTSANRILVVAVIATASVLGVTGCGSSGPKLSAKQQQVSTRIHDAGLSAKNADCIVGKLSGSALDLAGQDSNFGELSGTDGGKIAAAYSDCTAKNFQDTFHYDPSGNN